MTILADMDHALDVAGVMIGGPRFYWRMGAAARVALDAALKVSDRDEIVTRDDRGAVETLMGFPVMDATEFEGWELLREEEPTPLQPRTKRRK